MYKTLFPLAVSVVALIPFQAEAQLGSKLVEGVSAGVRAAVGAGDAKSESKPVSGSTADIESNVKSLQESIKKATDSLQRAGQSGVEKQKALDQLSQTVQVALKEVSDGGSMYSELKRAIDATKAKATAYADKSVDPKVSPQMQLKYRQLNEKLTNESDQLYRSMITLDKQRVNLEGRLKQVNENKEYVADLIGANDLVEANKAIMEVVSSMSNLDKSFDSLLNEIVKTATPEKTQ
jgi:hypothetical protein